MGRGKKTPQSVRDSILLDIQEGVLTNTQISKKHPVSYNSVLVIYDQFLFMQSKKVQTEDWGKGRTEPYQTEEEELYPTSNFYNATNRHKITPIQKGWQLFDETTENINGVEHFIIPSKMNKL